MMDMSPEKRQAFYQKQVGCFTPPQNQIQELLLRAYQSLLDSADKVEGGCPLDRSGNQG